MAKDQPESANSNSTPIGAVMEKDEDMFVLIDRANPWKDGKLVSSHKRPAENDTQSLDNGKSAQEKAGWETIPLVGGSSQWSKE
ncbi:hypothetical protein CIB48_g11583 [Xylaria polymorpha]|nr:hypothetical protein CIB48_g11583 [Xylaria polymorpha]